MKKVILLFCFVMSLSTTNAQQSLPNERPSKLYNQGVEMYRSGSYTAAIHKLEAYNQNTVDAAKNQEAEFLILASEFRLGKAEIDTRLKAYLEKYPSSIHQDEIAFFIGSSHYMQEDWAFAINWLNKVDISLLDEYDQDDLTYRLAYSYLQMKDTRGASLLFGLLAQNSKRYKEEATFLVAYIDFNNGDYNKAIPVFKSLKGKGKYSEKSTFFLIQSSYLAKKLDDVVLDGKSFLQTYPNSTEQGEVNRLIANSLYRQNKISDAISYYESYQLVESKPIRDDMYQLAEAYYRTGDYDKTIETLKMVASSEDLVGQAGNMLLGQAYLKKNDSDMAKISFESASRVNFSPSIGEEALYNYVMLVNSGSTSLFGESVTAMQGFLLKYPKSKYTPTVTKHMVAALLSAKDPQVALDAIAKIKNPNKDILAARQILFYQQGVNQASDGKYDIALASFNKSILVGNYDLNAKRESYFWRGDAAYNLGKYDAAISDFDNYNKQSNSSLHNYALGYYNLAYAYYQTKDYNSALSNFKRYTDVEKNKTSQTYTDAVNRIGDCYLFNRNYNSAESYYAKAVSSDPSNADYSEYQKAFVLGLQKKYSAKVSALDAMMKKYPNSSYIDNALFEKSRALVMMNKEQEATVVLEKLLKEHPRTSLAPTAGVQLGQLYFNMNQSQKSIDAYKKVVSDYPSSAESRTAINSLEGVYKDINDINGYATYLRSLGKGNVLTATRQDSLTYLAAENVYMKKNKAGAKDAFTQYLSAYPTGMFASDAHFYLGNMAFEAKNYKDAELYLGRVIKSNKSKYLDDALVIVSGIQFDKKEYDAAYKTYQHLEEATTNSENSNIANLGMLRCAYLQDKDEDVVVSADKIMTGSKLTQEVTNETLFYRGCSHRNLGQKDKAIADLKQVAKNSRSSFGAQSQYLLADLYYQNKDYDEAEKHVLAFMKQGTSHAYWMAKSILVLADTYSAKGDNFQARQYLESLQANYKGKEADVKKGIEERLTKISNAESQSVDE